MVKLPNTKKYSKYHCIGHITRMSVLHWKRKSKTLFANAICINIGKLTKASPNRPTNSNISNFSKGQIGLLTILSSMEEGRQGERSCSWFNNNGDSRSYCRWICWGHLSSNTQKKHLRAIITIDNKKVKPDNIENSAVILFIDNDYLEGFNWVHDDLMVIIATIHNYVVKRILVN